MELRGQAALVTGAGKRVGRFIALELARRGAAIAVHYNTSEPEARAVVEEIEAMGVAAEAFQAELRDEASIDRMFERVLARFPQLSMLVNNAAVFFPTPYEKVDGDVWDSVLDVNLRAYWLCARHAAVHLWKRGAGRIVNIGCVSCERPWQNYLPYAVSKAAVKALTENLALELAPMVQVNCVAPGTVLWSEKISPQRKEEVREQIPSRIEGHPQDIADTVAFLLTGPTYITGQTIYVDGGRVLR